MANSTARTDGASVKARVALVRCRSYDPEQVNQAVATGLSLLGGAERFVQSGEKIVLKPNLLVGSAPENAVTTHPSVFAAVARHLRAAGAELSYGDSPAIGRTEGVARRSGLAQMAEELGIPVADFSTPQTVSFHEGGLIKQFTVAAGVLAADGIISLPKFKTHGLIRMTGAIKNQFGCIPGVRKAEFHARLPQADLFSRMLVDLNRLLRPRLFVMDGIVAMEGNGPRGGSPRQMSVLLLSDDPVALDATACHIIALDPGLVPTITWGDIWGLGKSDQVEILGESLSSFVATDFVVNRRTADPSGGASARVATVTGVRDRSRRLLRNWVVPRPVITPRLCTRCGTCVDVCPVSPKGVDFRTRAGRKAVPRYDYDHCIRCYCCQELCPEGAIDIKTPLLGRLIHG